MATTPDLEPHPLVPRVASGLLAVDVPLIDMAAPLLEAQALADAQGEDAFKAVSTVKKAFAEAKQVNAELGAVLKDPELAVPLAAQEDGDGPQQDGDGNPELSSYAALVLAGAAGVPRLVTFAGYLGARFKMRDAEWCVLYLDTRLMHWLIVDTTGIVYRDKMRDDQAPCRQHDVIWVKADAAVGVGDAAEAVQSAFLTGDFTRAGDYDTPASGAPLAAATGVFCEARSVGCCKRGTNTSACKP
jgi:hypothetical protein